MWGLLAEGNLVSIDKLLDVVGDGGVPFGALNIDGEWIPGVCCCTSIRVSVSNIEA